MLALAVSASAIAKDSIPMTAGEYETISKPGNHRNSICFRQPVLNAEVLQAMMNYAGGGKQKCKVTPRSAKGNELTVRMICNYADGSDGRGEMVMRVNQNGFSSNSRFEITNGNDEKKNITTRTTGTRIGDCG